MKKYNVRIRGIRPLIHNRYDLDEAQKKRKKQKGSTFNPEKEVEKSLYRNTKGEIYQPADHIEGALIKTGPKFVIPNASRKTYKDRMKSQIFVSPSQISFNGNSNNYEIDIRSGVVPSTRGRIAIARPRWDNWEFDFQIQVLDENLVSGDILKEILETAGREQGIGTYRPKFGLFEVVKFEPVIENTKV